MPTKKASTRKSTKKPTDLGANRTGALTAPARAKEMAENTEAVAAAPLEAMGIALVRAERSQEAPPIGTMPVPGTVRGVAAAAMKAVQGKKASVFLDKLGERLAFERTGVRLYDALLAKVPAAKTSAGTLTVEKLREHRDDELEHMHLVKEALESVGGDPTAETPSADLKGVESMGLVRILTDPRTTLTQCLDAMLTAELADNEGWKMLIALAEAVGQEDLARRFTDALAEEDEHLASMRTWLAERLEIQLGSRLPSTDFGEPPEPPRAS
jgi:rubrerythrin